MDKVTCPPCPQSPHVCWDNAIRVGATVLGAVGQNEHRPHSEGLMLGFTLRCCRLETLKNSIFELCFTSEMQRDNKRARVEKNTRHAHPLLLAASFTCRFPRPCWPCDALWELRATQGGYEVGVLCLWLPFHPEFALNEEGNAALKNTNDTLSHPLLATYAPVPMVASHSRWKWCLEGRGKTWPPTALFSVGPSLSLVEDVGRICAYWEVR